MSQAMCCLPPRLLELVPRLDVEFAPRPLTEDGASRDTPPTIEGGSICEGWSTRDFLITGWDTAWTTA